MTGGAQASGLAGKVAVISGAGRSRSIGRSIAMELAREGCDLVLTGTGRTPDRYTEEERASGWRDIESVAEEARGLGVRALTAILDVSDEAAVDGLVNKVVAEFGGADVLVNNAAAARAGDRVPVTDLAADVWDFVMRVNVRGTFLMSRAFARQFVAQGRGGTIVNISSIAGKISGANAAAYSASKAAVQSLTSSMAKELGGDQIRVNALCPGIVSTSRLDDLTAHQWDVLIAERVPLGRAGTPQEIAFAVAFLASDKGRWITGQSWNIDGGQMTIR
ncbi:SDR family oxidoreductase [Rhodococcus sp. PAMC28707]|uniref:SDR family NAD(P)-dependent oxidoreductase n=1 Tax=unclassified Rhodococcus (in: high G+C Gram-positive bacteria) TaxID=192944 RepID=UPI00109D8629|nr:MULTISPECIES: SDR family oxidoreductase [unclassified Rhodococcus (in: high G+C Gram-positive bacteria)]QCB51410.1 SDR family oxidoreductase [Rhodococcus sp. PAMC28705]QCB60422.1 SDR family oxidoreductase [Rhodococcus sp. PAMC28707]